MERKELYWPKARAGAYQSSFNSCCLEELNNHIRVFPVNFRERKIKRCLISFQHEISCFRKTDRFNIDQTFLSGFFSGKMTLTWANGVSPRPGSKLKSLTSRLTQWLRSLLLILLWPSIDSNTGLQLLFSNILKMPHWVSKKTCFW